MASSWGVTRTASPASGALPLGKITLPGTRAGRPVIGTDSKGPVATATRYDGNGGVARKRSVRLPSAVVSRSIEVLAKAWCSAGTVRLTTHGSLNDGSSQQGK